MTDTRGEFRRRIPRSRLLLIGNYAQVSYYLVSSGMDKTLHTMRLRVMRLIMSHDSIIKLTRANNSFVILVSNERRITYGCTPHMRAAPLNARH